MGNAILNFMPLIDHILIIQQRNFSCSNTLDAGIIGISKIDIWNALKIY
jgi:hypothetical protein